MDGVFVNPANMLDGSRPPIDISRSTLGVQMVHATSVNSSTAANAVVPLTSSSTQCLAFAVGSWGGPCAFLALILSLGQSANSRYPATGASYCVLHLGWDDRGVYASCQIFPSGQSNVWISVQPLN